MAGLQISRFVSTAPLIAGTAAAYFVAAKLGLSLAFVAEQVTPVWPPAGLAIAAVLLFGARAAAGVAAGAFLANLTANEPALTAAGVAAGNTLEAVAAAWLLRSVGFDAALARLRDALAYVAFAVVVSPTIAASIGVVSLCAGGVQPWEALRSLWSVWWLGDATGALVFGPLLLVWWERLRRRRLPRYSPEAAALAAGTVAASVLVFGLPLGAHFVESPLHYTMFPLVVWAALRVGQAGVTGVTFVVSTVAIWSTVHGRGPFAAASAHDSLMLLQLYLFLLGATGLLLGAAIRERDAAERRAAEEMGRLEMSENRLRLALEAGHMGVWDWDLRSNDVRWSDNLEAVYGLRRGTFAHTLGSFRELIHPEDRGRVDEAVARARERDGAHDAEFRVLQPDGAVRWILVKGAVVRDRAGAAVRMLGIGMDVTARRKLEETLRDRARQLGDADRRKDEFLAMLAHELRNPLAPLANALHLLRLGSGDRPRLLEAADRQVRQLARLVDDLLDVSRITRGKISLRKETVVLADVVANAVDTVRTAIDAGGVSFTVSLPAHPVRLEADAARLSQVLANLLNNAVKFTPPGGSIWLTAEQLDREVVVRVRDTGSGVAPELLPAVFELFVQADVSLERASGGLGIGLTIVRRVVEMHGGTVEARSEGAGRGSEFVVRLPVGTPAPAAAPSSKPAPRERARSLRVLVVEDNRDSAETLAAILDLWGHEVRVAFDGETALATAEAFEPDVILSDVGLPGMNGYELARRLRGLPAFGNVVLVALSGYGREEDRRRALDAGFDHHMVKPADLTALNEMLGSVSSPAGRTNARTLH